MDTNINYFLFLKKKYEKILYSLIYIDELYEEIITSDETVNEDVEYEIISQKENQNKINHIKKTIEFINEQIIHTCNHNFIEDVIDISQENSQTITYCTICDYTKEYD